MSDINITVNDEIVNIDVIDTPVVVEVTNSPGPAGAGVAAGGTTGQVLSKASNTNYDTVWVNPSTGGVPYSGATGDVSLGEFGINVGNVIYDTTPTGIPTEQGATYWDADAETVALIMNGTIQKIGEDTFYHVRNTTGSTIAKGTAVRFSGTTGNSGRLLIAPMLADGTYPSQYYMGITAEELVNNADGKVYHFGKMRNINTSAFADGDVLYVSPSVAGALTATAPVAPNNIIVAAAVVHAANNGTLMIRTTLGSNINSDEGVLLTTPTANQGLFYDSGLWVNKSITTALGYTPANAATTLTINGVTYDLSTSRTWTIAAGISGSGASGQVTYWTGTSAVSGSNNLFWDNANGRLGIGTNAPAYAIDININQNFPTGFRVLNTTNGTQAESSFFLQSNTTSGYMGLFKNSTLRNVYKIISGNDAALYNATAGDISILNDFATGRIKFAAGASSTSQMTLFANGNLAINSGVTDLGVRFGVVGDTLLRGSGATSATTALTVQNSSSTNLFVVQNSGNVGIGTTSLSGMNLRITKSITGNGTGRSVYLSGDFQSDVSVGYGIQTSFGTQAATFTLSDLIYFQAAQGTKGSGSTIGTQVGFDVASMTNGSTNIAFRGQNASAANVWNLYMNGTADNYLAGNLGIGITPTVRLHVSGDTILKGSGATSATTALTVQNSSSTNLFVVRNDGNVGIGTNAPSSLVHAFASSGAATSGFMAQNNGTGASDLAAYSLQNQTQLSRIFLTTAAYTNVPMIGANGLAIYANGASGITFWNDNASGSIKFGVGSATAAGSQKMTIKVNGQVRFMPLASAPSGAEAGDVYYNSTDNKHYGYNGTTWNAFY